MDDKAKESAKNLKKIADQTKDPKAKEAINKKLRDIGKEIKK